MGQECELLANCGFFKKHKGSNDLACQGFIQQYCKGPKMDQCRRKQFRRENGTPPPDDMMPTGQTMAA